MVPRKKHVSIILRVVSVRPLSLSEPLWEYTPVPVGSLNSSSLFGVVENLHFQGGKALARVCPPAHDSTVQVHLFLESESNNRLTWVQIESLAREYTDPDGLELWTVTFDPLPGRRYMARARFKSHASNCRIAET